MTAVDISYGTAGTAITCSFGTLASSATVGQASTAVSNTTALALDALVSAELVLPTGTPADDMAVYFYAYGNVSTAAYTEGVSGTDESFTINSPTGLKLIGVVPTPTGGITYYGGPWSVAASFGGILPASWGIVVVNYSGLTLSSGSAYFQTIGATV
jgi:hypothetical protein